MKENEIISNEVLKLMKLSILRILCDSLTTLA